MRFPPKVLLVSALIPAFFLLDSQASQHVVVQEISVSASNPPVLHVQTSAFVALQVQVISNPERLVIDIPDSSPAPTLHAVNVDRGDLKRVRAGLFSTAPPTTRIVLDLNSPEWYRIIPDPAGFTVKLGTTNPGADGAFDAGSTIGWVSANVPANHVQGHPDPFLVKRTAPSSGTPASGLRVQFAGGLLEIHSQDATLSEVLFQVQKLTGAEIEIPAGTEQDRVAGDFGPADASEVLAQLLNGSELNFVMVGSPGSNLPSRVILSHKSAMPSEVISGNPPAPAASKTAQVSSDDISADTAADMQDQSLQQSESVSVPAPGTQSPEQPPTDFQQPQNPPPQN